MSISHACSMTVPPKKIDGECQKKKDLYHKLASVNQESGREKMSGEAWKNIPDIRRIVKEKIPIYEKSINKIY